MSTLYRHLTLDDRIEIKKRSWQPEHDHANLRPYHRNKLDTRNPRERLYLAGQAQLHADTRKARSHQPYRMRHDRLVDWVITHLRRGWTPEEISGRLPLEHPDDARMRVSPETLYAWIYSPKQQHRQLYQYLSRGQKKRRRIKGRRIHTMVERTSRFFIGVKLSQVAAAPTLQAQLEVCQALPAHAVKSVTADNGSEFAHHYMLADTIGVPTYIADPYSAYQRGSNEHFNGRLRKYLPKRTSFADLTQEELGEYTHEINNRPRKVLGWLTPAEVFYELCSQETHWVSHNSLPPHASEVESWGGLMARWKTLFRATKLRKRSTPSGRSVAKQ